jgi:hypothetical protein
LRGRGGVWPPRELGPCASAVAIRKQPPGAEPRTAAGRQRARIGL